jgi:small subunit ribosomal protein S21
MTTIRKEIHLLTKVQLRSNESQQNLLRRFRQQVTKSGRLKALRKKRWFVSKSEIRRIEKKKAIRRHRRKEYTQKQRRG